MKIIKSAAEGIAGLLGLAVLIIIFNALFSSNAPDHADLGSAPESAPTFVPPIDVSKLHVVNITQVDFHCNQAVSIAPDNEHYVCSKGGVGTGLWLGSFSKGLEKKLADNGGYARWLPNGRQIVYAEGVPFGRPTTLYELNIENGARTAIATTSDQWHFQILPDGRVTFLQAGLQVWNSNTRALRSLGQVSFGANSVASVDSNFIISPDGQQLAIQSVFYEKGTLYLQELSTGKVITLTNEVGNAVLPMGWSPDGRTLAYSFRPENTRDPELWLVNADGTNPRRLWRGELARAFEFLTWMPDGQTLLYINDPGGTSFEVGWTYMAISVKGGAPKALFTNGEGLALFDNGRKILIFRSVEDKGNWIVELSQ